MVYLGNKMAKFIQNKLLTYLFIPTFSCHFSLSALFQQQININTVLHAISFIISHLSFSLHKWHSHWYTYIRKYNIHCLICTSVQLVRNYTPVQQRRNIKKKTKCANKTFDLFSLFFYCVLFTFCKFNYMHNFRHCLFSESTKPDWCCRARWRVCVRERGRTLPGA